MPDNVSRLDQQGAQPDDGTVILLSVRLKRRERGVDLNLDFAEAGFALGAKKCDG
jgi:hypothetical protein